MASIRKRNFATTTRAARTRVMGWVQRRPQSALRQRMVTLFAGCVCSNPLNEVSDDLPESSEQEDEEYTTITRRSYPEYQPFQMLLYQL
jgi:hypothetical protein